MSTAVFARVRHWALSWHKSAITSQFPRNHLGIILPSAIKYSTWHLPMKLLIKNLNFYSSHVCYKTLPPPILCFNHPTTFNTENKLCSFSLYLFFHVLLGPKFSWPLRSEKVFIFILALSEICFGATYESKIIVPDSVQLAANQYIFRPSIPSRQVPNCLKLFKPKLI